MEDLDKSTEKEKERVVEKTRGVLGQFVDRFDPDAPDFDSEDIETPPGYTGQDYELSAVRDMSNGEYLGVTIVRAWGGINDGALLMAVAKYKDEDIPDSAKSMTPDLQLKSLWIEPPENIRMFDLGKGKNGIRHGWDSVEDDAGLLDTVAGELNNEWEITKKGVEPTGSLRPI